MKAVKNIKVCAICACIIFAASFVLCSCNNRTQKEETSAHKVEFMSTNPKIRFSGHEEVKNSDTIISQNWDKNLSRWSASSAFASDVVYSGK